MAGRVDALYFFLRRDHGLLLAADRRPDRLLRGQVPPARRRTASARGIHGGLVLEITWTVIPFLITMVIFVWGASVFFAMSRPPDETLNIYVVGKQWMWKFQHLDGQREINELHVPVGRPVKLIMTSEDVIHDVFVPAFRVKADVVPGRYTHLWFEPTKPGRYHLFCAEYCGTQHSGMIGEVVVHGAERVPGVAERRRAGRVAGVGRREAVPGSRVQHLPSARRAGPRAGARRAVRQDRARCRAARRSSSTRRTCANRFSTPAAKVAAGFQPIMPTFQGLVTEEQLLELIEYVKSLQGAAAGADHGSHGQSDALHAAAPLPERRLRHQVVAADARSQAHRAALPGRVTFFFFVGGAFAVLIRLELATPAGDLVTDETYNKLFTMHGVMMVFFFLIPAIPAVLGNFLVPIMIGAKDLAFPKLNLASWYIYMIGAAFTTVRARHRRPRHRLDVLHAVQHRVVDAATSSRRRSASSSPASRRSSPASTSSSRSTGCARRA